MIKPTRHWRFNGVGWESHDRSRCLPEKDCAEIILPKAREEVAEERAQAKADKD